MKKGELQIGPAQLKMKKGELQLRLKKRTTYKNQLVMKGRELLRTYTDQ
jgi:hypothetical protein